MSATKHARPLRVAALAEELKSDAEAVAVFEAAQRVKKAKQNVDLEVAGWRILYKQRGDKSHGFGDLYVYEPGEATVNCNHGGAARFGCGGGRGGLGRILP